MVYIINFFDGAATPSLLRCHTGVWIIKLLIALLTIMSYGASKLINLNMEVATTKFSRSGRVVFNGSSSQLIT